MRTTVKTIVWSSFTLAILLLLLPNVWVMYATRDQVFQSIDALPNTEVALVLGTSKKLENGRDNPYFMYRMDAAAELYKSGKVKHLILSGDNETQYYNEPQYMNEALLAKGIPASAITLDYAGFRTLDSVVRCKKIFGQSNFVIVTQRFHSYRALFIANHYNLKTAAYAADNLPFSQSFKVVLREILARPKAVIDLYILNITPRVLGEKEEVDVI